MLLSFSQRRSRSEPENKFDILDFATTKISRSKH